VNPKSWPSTPRATLLLRQRACHVLKVFGGYWRDFRGCRQRPEHRRGGWRPGRGRFATYRRVWPSIRRATSIWRIGTAASEGGYQRDHHDGGGGPSGFGGDGGPATKASLKAPLGIAVDKSGNLYIADTQNNRIRMVTASTGIISTLCGSSTSGYSGDGGPATNATLAGPNSVVVDLSGNLYIADAGNAAIRKISTGGSSPTGGGGQGGFGGDNGPATKAQLSSPNGIWVDASGNLYIADTGNQRHPVTSTRAHHHHYRGSRHGRLQRDGALATCRYAQHSGSRRARRHGRGLLDRRGQTPAFAASPWAA